VRNTDLYNAAFALLKVAPVVRVVDSNLSDYLLDKAEQFKDKIKIDKELEKEVLEFKTEIKKSL
jgi:mannose/cellobiose epimerase-like protein (N-acyl-D-glucosamine 2-epimerase family)